MVSEVPYTAILRDPSEDYHVRYVNLPMGLEQAREAMESRLDGNKRLVALIQGNMPVGLGGMKTVTSPNQGIPVWPF